MSNKITFSFKNRPKVNFSTSIHGSKVDNRSELQRNFDNLKPQNLFQEPSDIFKTLKNLRKSKQLPFKDLLNPQTDKAFAEAITLIFTLGRNSFQNKISLEHVGVKKLILLTTKTDTLIENRDHTILQNKLCSSKSQKIEFLQITSDFSHISDFETASTFLTYLSTSPSALKQFLFRALSSKIHANHFCGKLSEFLDHTYFCLYISSCLIAIGFCLIDLEATVYGKLFSSSDVVLSYGHQLFLIDFTHDPLLCEQKAAKLNAASTRLLENNLNACSISIAAGRYNPTKLEVETLNPDIKDSIAKNALISIGNLNNEEISSLKYYCSQSLANKIIISDHMKRGTHEDFEVEIAHGKTISRLEANQLVKVLGDNSYKDVRCKLKELIFNFEKYGKKDSYGFPPSLSARPILETNPELSEIVRRIIKGEPGIFINNTISWFPKNYEVLSPGVFLVDRKEAHDPRNNAIFHNEVHKKSAQEVDLSVRDNIDHILRESDQIDQSVGDDTLAKLLTLDFDIAFSSKIKGLYSDFEVLHSILHESRSGFDFIDYPKEAVKMFLDQVKDNVGYNKILQKYDFSRCALSSITLSKENRKRKGLIYKLSSFNNNGQVVISRNSGTLSQYNANSAIMVVNRDVLIPQKTNFKFQEFGTLLVSNPITVDIPFVDSSQEALQYSLIFSMGLSDALLPHSHIESDKNQRILSRVSYLGGSGYRPIALMFDFQKKLSNSATSLFSDYNSVISGLRVPVKITLSDLILAKDMIIRSFCGSRVSSSEDISKLAVRSNCSLVSPCISTCVIPAGILPNPVGQILCNYIGKFAPYSGGSGITMEKRSCIEFLKVIKLSKDAQLADPFCLSGLSPQISSLLVNGPVNVDQIKEEINRAVEAVVNDDKKQFCSNLFVTSIYASSSASKLTAEIASDLVYHAATTTIVEIATERSMAKTQPSVLENGYISTKQPAFIECLNLLGIDMNSMTKTSEVSIIKSRLKEIDCSLSALSSDKRVEFYEVFVSSFAKIFSLEKTREISTQDLRARIIQKFVETVMRNSCKYFPGSAILKRDKTRCLSELVNPKGPGKTKGTKILIADDMEKYGPLLSTRCMAGMISALPFPSEFKALACELYYGYTVKYVRPPDVLLNTLKDTSFDSDPQTLIFRAEAKKEGVLDLLEDSLSEGYVEWNHGMAQGLLQFSADCLRSTANEAITDVLGHLGISSNYLNTSDDGVRVTFDAKHISKYAAYKKLNIVISVMNNVFPLFSQKLNLKKTRASFSDFDLNQEFLVQGRPVISYLRSFSHQGSSQIPADMSLAILQNLTHTDQAISEGCPASVACLASLLKWKSTYVRHRLLKPFIQQGFPKQSFFLSPIIDPLMNFFYTPPTVLAFYDCCRLDSQSFRLIERRTAQNFRRLIQKALSIHSIIATQNPLRGSIEAELASQTSLETVVSTGVKVRLPKGLSKVLKLIEGFKPEISSFFSPDQSLVKQEISKILFERINIDTSQVYEDASPLFASAAISFGYNTQGFVLVTKDKDKISSSTITLQQYVDYCKAGFNSPPPAISLHKTERPPLLYEALEESKTLGLAAQTNRSFHVNFFGKTQFNFRRISLFSNRISTSPISEIVAFFTKEGEQQDLLSYIQVSKGVSTGTEFLPISDYFSARAVYNSSSSLIKKIVGRTSLKIPLNVSNSENLANKYMASISCRSSSSLVIKQFNKVRERSTPSAQISSIEQASKHCYLNAIQNSMFSIQPHHPQLANIPEDLVGNKYDSENKLPTVKPISFDDIRGTLRRLAFSTKLKVNFDYNTFKEIVRVCFRSHADILIRPGIIASTRNVSNDCLLVSYRELNLNQSEKYELDFVVALEESHIPESFKHLKVIRPSGYLEVLGNSPHVVLTIQSEFLPSKPISNYRPDQVKYTRNFKRKSLYVLLDLFKNPGSSPSLPITKDLFKTADPISQDSQEACFAALYLYLRENDEHFRQKESSLFMSDLLVSDPTTACFNICRRIKDYYIESFQKPEVEEDSVECIFDFSENVDQGFQDESVTLHLRDLFFCFILSDYPFLLVNSYLGYKRQGYPATLRYNTFGISPTITSRLLKNQQEEDYLEIDLEEYEERKELGVFEQETEEITALNKFSLSVDAFEDSKFKAESYYKDDYSADPSPEHVLASDACIRLQHSKTLRAYCQQNPIIAFLILLRKDRAALLRILGSTRDVFLQKNLLSALSYCWVHENFSDEILSIPKNVTRTVKAIVNCEPSMFEIRDDVFSKTIAALCNFTFLDCRQRKRRISCDKSPLTRILKTSSASSKRPDGGLFDLEFMKSEITKEDRGRVSKSLRFLLSQAGFTKGKPYESVLSLIEHTKVCELLNILS